MLVKTLCTLISMCCMLSPIGVKAEKTTQTSYNFNYSADVEFQTVLQVNIDKMESVTKGTATTYSSEFVVDYVSPSRDYDEVVETLNRVQSISDTICENTSNDYEKLQKIHDYVCENVSYDHISAKDSANFDTICLKNVIERKRSICAGYANLFSALCNAQGLYCINIRGSVRTAEVPNVADETAPTNHEWNAVWYDEEDRWIFIDCTWDSNNDYDEDGFTYADAKRQYFDMSMEEMSTRHKVKIIDHRDFFDSINYFSTVETSANFEDTATTESVSSAENTSLLDSTKSHYIFFAFGTILLVCIVAANIKRRK